MLNITKGEISSLSPVKKKEHWIINGNIELAEGASSSSFVDLKGYRTGG